MNELKHPLRGPALDRLVAIDVLGVKRLEEEAMKAEALRVWAEQPDCRYFMAGFYAEPDERGEPVVSQNFVSYSTDHRHAWFLVQHLISTGLRFNLTATGNGVVASFSTYPDPSGMTQTFSGGPYELMPEAVCKAALAATSLQKSRKS